jgi:glycosyltransferase involved in cell wall biosynthesis
MNVHIDVAPPSRGARGAATVLPHLRTPPVPKRRTWTINGRFLSQNVTGVQRYGREILQALDTHLAEGHPLARDLSIELLVPNTTLSVPPLKHIRMHKAWGLRGHLWEQVVLPIHARGAILSLCNTSAILPAKQIVCIHDLNTVTHPKSYSGVFRGLYRAIIPRVLKRAAAVATVSQYSAQQLATHGPAVLKHVYVIPDGHEHVRQWCQVETKSAGTAVVDDATIVIIGSPAPHKNIRLILELAPELADHGIRIAVVGRLDTRVFQNRRDLPRSNTITWLGAVSDGELRRLYQSCLCLAFPSRAEGFGLPPLEAMALGCPVVSSNCASMPEVCGDSVLYASPDDPRAWLQAFVALRTNTQLRALLVQRGRARAQTFTWRRSAELYLEVMASLDGLDVEQRMPATVESNVHRTSQDEGCRV